MSMKGILTKTQELTVENHYLTNRTNHCGFKSACLRTWKLNEVMCPSEKRGKSDRKHVLEDIHGKSRVKYNLTQSNRKTVLRPTIRDICIYSYLEWLIEEKEAA